MAFSIDQMELADIGHPRTLARALQDQIRDQLGSIPHEFPLEELATELGVVEISKFESDSIEGMLVVQGDLRIIGINAKAKPTRARFTIGHELGHAVIPTHLAGKTQFKCGRSEFAAERPRRGLLAEGVSIAQRKEIEANEFASELLVPHVEFRAFSERLGDDANLLHLRALAQAFKVSTEMMSRIYVERASEKIGIIISKNGKLARLIIPRNFPYLGLRKNVELPQRSLTRSILSIGRQTEVPSPERLASSIWFDEDQNVTGLAEQCLLLRGGWALTLLSVQKITETDDEPWSGLRPADSMWSRERSGRFSWD